ncbi:MAG: ATP synthase F0 subunit A [Actinobacteria bacterium 13_1_20CM_3_71_11]|nr:MAG: ATP synthase F0 subunit A [Actinobacteria bacterium 13_1_20CM_3_71_11]
MITSVLAEQIKIGVHPTATLFGLTFDLDTILSTVVAGIIVIALGFWLRSRVTSTGVPTRIQLFWETLVKWIQDQVEGLMGVRVAPYTVPLGVALFLFILISNWIELIPTGHHLPAPTADANTPYALALLVIVWVHAASIRRNGIGRYVGHYFKPVPALFPLNVLEELVKPVSLSLRLFGNIFAGAIMIEIIGLLPQYALWLPNAAWKLFDMFVGVIQAIIFTLLTITYFSLQLTSDEH